MISGCRQKPGIIDGREHLSEMLLFPRLFTIPVLYCDLLPVFGGYLTNGVKFRETGPLWGYADGVLCPDYNNSAAMTAGT